MRPFIILLLLSFSRPFMFASDLPERLEKVAVEAARADVGYAVQNLDAVENFALNGDRRFPMQSVVKLPVAIAVLHLVDQKKLTLEQNVPITAAHHAPGWSPLSKKLQGSDGSATVRELLGYAVAESDNTAVDVLIELAGGTGAVQKILEGLKIENVRVDRTEAELQTVALGLPGNNPAFIDYDKYTAALDKLPEETRKAALKSYLADQRDTATPQGMVRLLARLHKKLMLSESSTELLLTIMAETPHGKNRLKGGLPRDWTLAHKTGTGGDVLGTNTATNDVGIACSPEGRCYAIAVFIAGSKASIEERERVMSNIAAAVAGGEGR